MVVVHVISLFLRQYKEIIAVSAQFWLMSTVSIGTNLLWEPCYRDGAGRGAGGEGHGERSAPAAGEKIFDIAGSMG
jgi:hypothetical protein